MNKETLMEFTKKLDYIFMRMIFISKILTALFNNSARLLLLVCPEMVCINHQHRPTYRETGQIADRRPVRVSVRVA